MSSVYQDLYLDLLWLEYMDVVQEARDALVQGHKLGALGLAVIAYKAKSDYERRAVPAENKTSTH